MAGKATHATKVFGTVESKRLQTKVSFNHQAFNAVKLTCVKNLQRGLNHSSLSSCLAYCKGSSQPSDAEHAA